MFFQEVFSRNLTKFNFFLLINQRARSRILEPENYKDREKYLIKFLKIMKVISKHKKFLLRKVSTFLFKAFKKNEQFQLLFVNLVSS